MSGRVQHYPKVVRTVRGCWAVRFPPAATAKATAASRLSTSISKCIILVWALVYLPPIFAAAAQSIPDLGILANSSRLLRQK
jgi:hypothetical protein